MKRGALYEVLLYIFSHLSIMTVRKICHGEMASSIISPFIDRLMSAVFVILVPEELTFK